MLRNLVSLVAAVQLLLTNAVPVETQLQTMFQSGQMLRLHVVAQDDTESMQRMKLCVRDAVQNAYAVHCPDNAATMLENTAAILPQLAQAAEASARAHGFAGEVRLVLDAFAFDALPLAQHTVPAGEYPALMVYLGDAQGHNWWGLIDPEMALAFAQIPTSDEDDPRITWDWSLRGFWDALLSRLTSAKEANLDASQP